MRVAAVILCSVLSFSSQAQQASPQWRLEPVAVLGVKLGVPIQESEIPRCSSVDAKADEPCLEKQGGLAEAPARYGVMRHPFLYAEFTAIVDDTGVVSQVMVLLNQSKFSEFSSVLVERYGAPATSTTTQWQNRAGGRFPSRELTWGGKKVRILAMERGHTVDRSVIAIQDIAAVDRELQKANEKVKGAASKL